MKTKVSNSSFARKHIYLTFKYYGLILSSLNFRPLRLDNREDNRKISGKTWHIRTKILFHSWLQEVSFTSKGHIP